MSATAEENSKQMHPLHRSDYEHRAQGTVTQWHISIKTVTFLKFVHHTPTTVLQVFDLLTHTGHTQSQPQPYRVSKRLNSSALFYFGNRWRNSRPMTCSRPGGGRKVHAADFPQTGPVKKIT